MRIEKTECNYQVTECDLKFGEQITLDGELLIPISVLDKIRAEIIKRDRNVKAIRSDGRCFFTVEEILEIIDKYKVESEG